MKIKSLLVATMLFIPAVHVFAQQSRPGKISVMTLGVFHFSYPNLDEHRVATGNEIDVLLPKYQAEIENLVSKLKQFAPTRIAIEVQPEYRARYDSLYDAYLKGEYTPGRNEVFQIGFRLGKAMGIGRLSCVDAQGRYYEYLDTLFADSAREAAFEYYFKHNPDSVLAKSYAEFYGAADRLPGSVGIIGTLERMNLPAFIRHLQGAYFIGDFEYEEKKGDYTGADFETCRWYNRNLRIFRNIQRITHNEKDRILVIIGDGHLGLLNYFFQCSPEYRLVTPLKYLKRPG